MKSFIVFIAFVLVFGSFLVFENDLASYQSVQRELKMLAEELACGAALLTGDEENHSCTILKDEALLYVEQMASLESSACRRLKNGRLTADTEFPDESSVRVILEFIPYGRMFYFAPSGIKIRRSAIYQWVLKS